MRVVARVDEAEVEAAFVRAELAGRFRDEIVGGTRGWRIGGLFDGFPEQLDWSRAALTADEVLAVKYINWDWWLEISAGTRSPREAARRIHAGLVPAVVAEGYRVIAERLRSDDPPPELIAVATPDGPLVLVEGHVRLTSYALYPEYLPQRVEIYLGRADAVAEWSEY